MRILKTVVISISFEKQILFNMIDIFPTIIIFGVFFYLLYKFSTRKFRYWKEKNVPYAKPLPFLGNFWKIISLQTQIGTFLADLYKQFDAPYFGIYILNNPFLILKCPKLIKTILVDDFNNFPCRSVICDERCDPVGSKFLFLSGHQRWKPIRRSMAPIFSTGKLKGVVNAIDKSVENLKAYLQANSHQGPLQAKDISERYATDVITSYAFGTQADSFKSEHPKFRTVGSLIFRYDLRNSIGQTLSFLWPTFVQFFKLPYFNPRFTSFIRSVFWEMFNKRRETKEIFHKENDLINYLLQLKKDNKFEEYDLDGDKAVAIAGQLFAAGFETVSSTISFALYELCLQPEIQDKLRKEIKCSLLKHGKIGYDALLDMPYLDMVLNETLRKYPTFPFLDRISINDYQVPGTNLVIEKGTPLYIPLLGLHYDPAYFPNPDKFIPERFSEGGKNLQECVFIPFGKGPRNCIGARFALLVCKLGIAHIISKFELIKSSQTPVPVDYVTKGITIGTKNGLPLIFEKL